MKTRTPIKGAAKRESEKAEKLDTHQAKSRKSWTPEKLDTHQRGGTRIGISTEKLDTHQNV